MYLLKRTLMLVACVAGALIPAIILILLNMEPQTEVYKLPYVDNDSGIVLEKLLSYDGVFVEDRSNDPVQGVAAGVIKNNGNLCIESACVDVFVEGSKYSFEICMLLPGMRVLVLDARKAEYSGNSIINLTVISKIFEHNPAELILHQTTDYGDLLINQYDRCVSISVYHRIWSESEEMYYGGIAYKTYIRNFVPGDRLVLKPDYTFPSEAILVLIA